MSRYTIAFFIFALFFTFSCAGASEMQFTETFMPKNNLHLEDSFYNADISKVKADAILDSIKNIYTPIFEKNGLTLTIINDWDNSEVNAVAYQRGKNAYVKIYGGLIRRWEITEDGMALVACHEIGHHLGGFPLYDDIAWASAEGNSDYFATHMCAKAIFKDPESVFEDSEDSNKSICLDDYADAMCVKMHPLQEGRDICCRTANAIESLVMLLGQSGSERFDTPSKKVVSRTSVRHPDAQCRMDTMLQGALCLVENTDDKIPWSEKEMRMKSCTRKHNFKVGNRPRCWFKPSKY